MTPVRILLSTIDNEKRAQQIAYQLTKERLAACVNIISNVTSVYKWKGETEQATECLLIVKTTKDRLEKLTARLVDLHPYDVPEVVTFSVEQGYPPYLEWVVSETRES